MTWTPEQIDSLAGRVVVVTGANTGLGYETARVCAARGATTVLACRSRERAEEARGRILGRHPEASVLVADLDLGRFASIRAFSEAFHARHDHLFGLVNNAGIMFTPYGTTEDGLERQTGVNHYGHFLLTGLLLDRLLATPGSRVVTVSSLAHRSGRMDWEAPTFEGGRDYSPQKAYGRSKLQNLLFTFELQRRLAEVGASTLALAAHPGGAATDLSRYAVQDSAFFRFALRLFAPFIQSAYEGALPTLRALTDPDAAAGACYGPDGFMQMRGRPVLVSTTPAARDPEAARRLWRLSEELTGLTYDFGASPPT